MCTEKIIQHSCILFIDMYICILLLTVKNHHIYKPLKYCHIYTCRNMRIVDNIHDGEILSLRGTPPMEEAVNSSHTWCWAIVRPNDFDQLKASVVLIDGVDRRGIKAVLRILDETELCTCLGKNSAALKKSSNDFVNNFFQVIELYDSNENAAKRAKSNNNDIAVCSFQRLMDIQILEQMLQEQDKPSSPSINLHEKIN